MKFVRIGRWTGWSGVKKNPARGRVRHNVIGGGTVVDLSGYIPAPVAGGTPVASFAAGGRCVGIVAWAPDDEVFQANRTYRATVKLYPMTGLTFGDELILTCANGKVTGRTKTDELITLTITFDATAAEAEAEAEAGSTAEAEAAPTAEAEAAPTAEAGAGPTAVTAMAVPDLNLIDYVPAPESGGPLVRSFAAPGCVGIVKWTSPRDFAEGKKQYVAAVSLYPTAGYTLKKGTTVSYKRIEPAQEEGTVNSE